MCSIRNAQYSFTRVPHYGHGHPITSVSDRRVSRFPEPGSQVQRRFGFTPGECNWATSQPVIRLTRSYRATIENQIDETTKYLAGEFRPRPRLARLRQLSRALPPARRRISSALRLLLPSLALDGCSFRERRRKPAGRTPHRRRSRCSPYSDPTCSRPGARTTRLQKLRRRWIPAC